MPKQPKDLQFLEDCLKEQLVFWLEDRDTEPGVREFLDGLIEYDKCDYRFKPELDAVHSLLESFIHDFKKELQAVKARGEKLPAF